jgi:hypothetical protein
MAYRQLDMPQAFEQTKRQMYDQGTFMEQLAPAIREANKRLGGAARQKSGFLTISAIPYFSGIDPAWINIQIESRAEYAVFDQAAVAVLLVLLLMLVAVRQGGSWVGEKWQGNRPIFVFIGWRRLFRFVLLTGVVPVGLYGLYAWLIPGVRKFGLPLADSRIIVEYAFIMAVVFMLLRRLGDQAVRQRACELNIPLPALKPIGIHWIGITLFAIATIGYEIIWHFLVLKRTDYWVATSSLKGWGYVLAMALLAYGLFWLVRPSHASPTGREARQKFHHLVDALGALLISGTIISALLIYANSAYPTIVTLTPWLICIAALCLIAAAGAVIIQAITIRAGRQASDRPILRPHGAMPILLTLVLVLGLGFGGLLRWQEHRAIIQLDPTGTRWLDQIQFSHYRLLAEWMQKQPSPSKP